MPAKRALAVGAGELGGAAVEDDGLPGGGGELHLGDEGGVLAGGEGALEVVVVEADLAAGDDERVSEEVGDLGEGCVVGEVGVAGVDAGGGEDAGVGRVVSGVGGAGDVAGAVHGGGAVADADAEDGLDAGCLCAGEDLRALRVVGAVGGCRSGRGGRGSRRAREVI